MRFFKALVGAVALATSAAAQLAFTSAPTNVEQQVPVTFTYTASDMTAPVSISLMEGDLSNPAGLATVLVITSTATGGSYTWNPPANLVSNTDYAFAISQGSEVNYFGPVVLNASLEPGSPSTPPPVPTSTSIIAPPPAPITSTTIVSPPAPITTMPPVYNTSTVIVPPPISTPPANVTSPGIPPTTPPPISGAQALAVSFTSLAAIFGAFLFFL